MRIRSFLTIAFLSYSFLAMANFDLTIITSVYDGDFYIKNFLEEISKQTIYSKCQHIIVNANSPGNEEDIIKPFLATHPNVEYYSLDKDPGLYAVWNFAIKNSLSEYIINANLDDRLRYDTYQILLSEISSDSTIDLVYSDAYITQKPNQSFGKHQYDSSYIAPEFSHESLVTGCYIGSHPMWRKSLHEKFGYFNESFTCAGDWEMWLRASYNGAKFMHLNELTGLNYIGAKTLSSSSKFAIKRKWEAEVIHSLYRQTK